MARKIKANGALAEMVVKQSGSPEEMNVLSKERVRQRLLADTEAFLSRGGAIDYIEPNVLAQPPTKPITNYGSRPI